MEYFWQGLLMGLAYVAPIGIQNMFVINTALNSKKRRAIMVALIVAFFDISLALACFFGVGMILNSYQVLKIAILLLGGTVVVVIGVKLILAKQAEVAYEKNVLPWRKIIATACVVTWCNPQAIIDGSLMLGAFYTTLQNKEALYFIAGVASASFLWFNGLALVFSSFAGKISAKFLRCINVICGTVIIFYGLKLFWELYELIISFC